MIEEYKEDIIELVELLDDFLEVMDYVDENNEEDINLLGEMFTEIGKQFIKFAQPVARNLVKNKKMIEEENFFPDIIGND